MDDTVDETTVDEDKVDIDDESMVVKEDDLVDEDTVVDETMVVEGEEDVDERVELLDEDVVFAPTESRLTQVVPRFAVSLKLSAMRLVPLPMETSNFVFWL